MKIKHESSSLVSKATNEVLVSFMTEALDAISDCKYLVDSITRKQSGELDEDDLLDVIESPLLTNTKSIVMYRSCCFSIYNGINYYMKTIVEYINNVSNNLEKLNSMGVYLTEDWENLLKSEASVIIGGLCHVLWHEFSMENYLNLVAEGVEDPEIDEIFYTYCDNCFLTPTEVANAINADRNTYKFKLNFFDQYPEHESIFEELMGPYIVGVNESVLTLDMVLKLENGDITPAELCESCELLSNGTVDGLDIE